MTATWRTSNALPKLENERITQHFRTFLRSGRNQPRKKAIVHKGRCVTFGELAAEVKRTAAYFSSKGISKGDRVLVFVPMSIELYQTVLALFYLGATAVFLDEWVNRRRLALCCSIADCKGFIAPFKVRMLALTSGPVRKIPVWLKTVKTLSGEVKMCDVSPGDTALITFTTGSTGTPKAAKRTHGFLQAQFDALKEKLKPGPDEIDMPVLPVVLLVNLGTGNTSVIPDFRSSKPEKMKPDRILGEIAVNNVSRIIASPFFIKKLALEALASGKKNQLQKIFTGGAPVFPAEAEIYLKGFPDAETEIVYGSTEAEPISSIGAKRLIAERDKVFSLGLPAGKIYRGQT